MRVTVGAADAGGGGEGRWPGDGGGRGHKRRRGRRSLARSRGWSRPQTAAVAKVAGPEPGVVATTNGGGGEGRWPGAGGCRDHKRRRWRRSLGRSRGWSRPRTAGTWRGVTGEPHLASRADRSDLHVLTFDAP